MAYGSPPEKHKKRLSMDLLFIKQDVSHVKHDLQRGDCSAALFHIVELNIQLGQARAQAQALGLTKKALAVQHKQGRDLSARFKKACVLKKK
jgi:hypothetical protein